MTLHIHLTLHATIRSFTIFVSSTSNDDKRDKNALDDIIAALQYVVDSMAVSEPAKKKSKTDRKHGVDAVATLPTMSFCMSIFLQFVFMGEVSVNGKLMKAYSNLRSELQQIMLSAQETFVSESAAGKEVDAMELASLLAEQFADKPVISVVGDDEEEACAKRVVATMNISSHVEHVVKPLKDFVHKTLHLPLMLHEVPQKALMELSSFSSSAESSMQGIIDVVAFIQSKLDEHFPFAWVFFTSDVAEVLACKGHFLESSGQAGWLQIHVCLFGLSN